MKPLKYILDASLISVRKYRILNMVVFFSLIVSLIMPLFSISILLTAIKSINAFKIKDSSNVYLINFKGPIADADDLEGIERLLGANEITNIIYNSMLDVTINGEVRNGRGVDENIEKFVNIDVSKGRYFTAEDFKENRPCCVLAHFNDNSFEGINIGDTATISGVDFNIIGIVNTFLISGVIIPAYYSREFLGENVQQCIAVNSSEALNESQILNAMLKTLGFLEISSVMTADEYIGFKIQEMIDMRVETSIICLFSIVFALINISLITLGKINEQKRSIGIKKALGATNLQIYAGFILENTTLFIAAMITLAILKPAMTRFCFPPAYRAGLDIDCYLITFVLGLIMQLLSSALFYRGIIKNSASSIMRGDI